MTLPLQPPLLPQLARPRASLPEGDGWAYEPKWDGFRAIVFVDGDETYLQSRNGKPLSRYFPEPTFLAGRFVLDGEIVAASFDNSASASTRRRRGSPGSRRRRRRASSPSRSAVDDEVLIECSYEQRRAVLEGIEGPEPTPVERTADGAQRRLHEEEGVIAKELAAPYLPGERKGMVKIKRVRTIDAVVMGWRPGKKEGTVGAISSASTTTTGACANRPPSGSRPSASRAVDKLAPYETGERGSGDASRWTQGRELERVALRPELVVEVTFDHVSDEDIRHGTRSCAGATTSRRRSA